jgi:tetratricopeptide (TPR) repeat protein
VPFQFDDLRIIPDNPYIKNLENFSFLKEHQYNPKDEYNARRYLGYLSLALNYRWGGLEVTGYHIMNLLIHLINGILVYFFVILTFRTPYFKGLGAGGWGVEKSEPVVGRHESRGNIYDFQSPIPNLQSPIPSFIALFSALLFVAHPVQTQAVTYIAQRFTSLAALFYLASVVFYVKGRLASTQADKLGSWQAVKPASYILSLFFAVCAMKVKEISFTLPIMILLYEFIFFRTTLKRKLLLLIPVLLTLVIVPISVLQIDKPLGEVLSDLSEKSRLQTDMPRGDYLMTELRVIVTYIRLIFLPVNQNLDYDYPIYRSFFSPPVFLSFLFLATLFGIALYLIYKSRLTDGPASSEAGKLGSVFHLSRLIGFGILWFFLALSVESSFIPIVDVIFEHRLYLPSIGAFVALSAALLAAVMKAKDRWPGSEKAVIPIVLIIVLMLSAATFARNRVWQDKTRLWEDVVRKSPGNARAHNNLCFVYIENRMDDQAIQQCRAALGLRPDYLDALINLGVAYNAKGMYDQAIEHFLIALSLNPDDADAHNNLGIAYVSKGMFDEAIKHYQIAVRLWPDYAEAYNNLGVAYGSRGMSAEAIGYFEQAIRLKADYFEANYNLALIYGKMGDDEKASALYNKARDMKPADNLP